jgi:hypothetical protein
MTFRSCRNILLAETCVGVTGLVNKQVRTCPQTQHFCCVSFTFLYAKFVTTFLQTTHTWTHRRKMILVSRPHLTSIIIEILWWELLSISFKQRQAMLRSILLDPRCPTVSSALARTSKRTQSVPIIKTDHCDRSQTYVRLLLLLLLLLLLRDLDVGGKVSEIFSSSPK